MMKLRNLLFMLAVLTTPLQTFALEFTPKIANGVDTQDWPATVALVDATTNQYFCSGVLIGCSTVLTAAHCVCDTTGANCQPGGIDLQSPSSIKIAMQHGETVGVTDIFVPSNFLHVADATNVADAKGDVAVLKLSTPVTGIAPVKLNNSAFNQTGVTGTIVGFGTTTETGIDGGIKRKGEVINGSCQSGTTNIGLSNSEFICWKFGPPPHGPAGQDSNTCPGDSGAPLFMDLGSGNVLTGISSGGSTGTCDTEDVSFDTDVFNNLTFIQNKGGSDLNSNTCGALPQAGQTGTTIVKQNGNVDSSTQQKFHTVDVPAGTNQVRFVLNGAKGDEGSGNANDFDLFVKQGSQPGVGQGQSDCASQAAGPFESCIFNNPLAGTWHVLVDYNSGSGGQYQLTTTLFGASTVDKIGVWRPSDRKFYLDANGNRQWNAGDLISAPFGQTNDIPVVGDWDGDGDDDIGVWRPSTRRFYLDANGNRQWNSGDLISAPFGQTNDIPVVGDWDGDGDDDIGVWRPSNRRFYLDANGNRQWNAGDLISAPFGQTNDIPVVGDWDGDGDDDIGVWRPSDRKFYLDANGNRQWNAGDLISAPFGQTNDIPVVGDWDGDGDNDIGVWRPSDRKFYLDANGNRQWNSGDLISAPFGLAGDKPLTGKW